MCLRGRSTCHVMQAIAEAGLTGRRLACFRASSIVTERLMTEDFMRKLTIRWSLSSIALVANRPLLQRRYPTVARIVRFNKIPSGLPTGASRRCSGRLLGRPVISIIPGSDLRLRMPAAHTAKFLMFLGFFDQVARNIKWNMHWIYRLNSSGATKNLRNPRNLI
jgi:hypothetical protein